MKLTMSAGNYYPSTLEISVADSKRLQLNSLERLLNCSIEVAKHSKHPDAGELINNIKELKLLASQLWYSASQAAFAYDAQMFP